MIGVGINDNVILMNAEFSTQEGKGSRIILTFDSAENAGKKDPAADVFDQLQTAKVENDGKSGISLNIFNFKVPDGQKNEGKTAEEKLQMVSDDMARVKNQLTQLLEQYLLTDNIKWDPYYNTGVTKENYRTAFLDNDVLGKVFANYGNQFVTMVTPFLGKPEHKLRLKLVRQSKEKHFATIPGKFLADRPYVESMDIPAEQAKVKFSDWEIANKLNDPTPLAAAAADAAPVQSNEAPTTANVFGNR